MSANCNQDKVNECVKLGKYCNVDTNNCILPKGVTTKVNKDPNIIASPAHGVMGQKQAVENVKKYLKALNAAEQQPLMITAAKKTVAVPAAASAGTAEAAIVAKVSSKKASPVKELVAIVAKKGKKVCTAEQCAQEGKLCNTDTGNCIKDTPANRRKLGITAPAVAAVAAPVVVAAAAPAVIATVSSKKTSPVKLNYANLTVVQLREELRKRNLTMNGIKAVLIARLEANDLVKSKQAPVAVQAIVQAAPSEVTQIASVAKKTMEKTYYTMTNKELKDILRARSLSMSGAKDVLIARLVAYDKKMAEAPEAEPQPLLSAKELQEIVEEQGIEAVEPIIEQAAAIQIEEPKEPEEYEEISDADLAEAQKVKEAEEFLQKFLAQKGKAAKEKAEPSAMDKLLAQVRAEQEKEEAIKARTFKPRPVIAGVPRASTIRAIAEKKEQAKAEQVVQEYLRKKCTEVGCEKDEVCNVDTGICGRVEDPSTIVKNYHMLVNNGAVYYGSKKALESFASTMGIQPDIQRATKTKMKEAQRAGAGEAVRAFAEETKEVPEPIANIPELIEEEEAEAELERPSVVIPQIPVDITIEEEDEESPAQVAKILQDVSAEKPLTLQEKELVEHIKACLGI